MAAISQRIKGNISGDILLNNQKVTSTEMKGLSGYVPQYDISIPTMTPVEHLYFLVIQSVILADF